MALKFKLAKSISRYILYRKIKNHFIKDIFMPLYDFYCEQCAKSFEEICSTEDTPPCPICGSSKVSKKLSAPSPLKTGAFPYKVGPVHPIANRPPKNNCGGGACGGGFS